MSKINTIQAAVLAVCLSAVSYANAAGTISKPDYKMGKETAAATYKTDKEACSKMADNAKDICMAEAKGKEKVTKAELEYNYTGKMSDHKHLADVKAETAYDIAKEKCDDKSGNDKDVCVKEAKAVEIKAKADAKLDKKVGDASMDAVEDKMGADYKVAKEKCDGMSGDAKSSCMDSAKMHYKK